MGKDRNGHLRDSSDEETEAPANPKSDSEQEDTKSKSHSKSDKGEKPSKSRRRQSSSSSSEDEDSYSDSESESGSESDYSGSESEYLDSEEEERRRRKRKRREREERERRRRRKEKEKKRRRKEKEREEERKRKKRKEKERKEKKKKKKKERLERGKKGAVTNSWGKYGVIKETDMWNKRPEFTAWLAEVKQINLENLPNWEEKQLFKEFMEDHNTATFPSKKYYGLDAYYRHKMEKDMKKGVKKSLGTERTEFNDEEQRRQELLIAREKQKEGQVEALKHAMQSGMAQAMKEQAQLREEMAYHYKVGNFEAAAAIQKRLDPDIPM